MTAECQEAALVARHQVIGLAALGHGQQKIVRGIGGAFHARQRIDVLGELLDLVDQGIKVWDKLVLVCSKNSLSTKTGWWVEQEVERALAKER